MKNFYEKYILNPKAKLIVSLLKDYPENWKFGMYDTKKEPYTIDLLDLEIWIHSGWYACFIWKPTKEYLGIIGSLITYKAAKKWMKDHKHLHPRNSNDDFFDNIEEVLSKKL